MKDTKGSNSFFKRLLESKKNIYYIVCCLTGYVITVTIVNYYEQLGISIYLCMAPLILFIYCMLNLSNIIMDISRQMALEKKKAIKGDKKNR